MMQNPFTMVGLLKTAVSNIDWRYVTLSRRRYNESRVCVKLGDSHWLERPFAYEIYHQLRLIWAADVFDCLIQAEVFKRYQEVKDVKKMPDFLIHDPVSDHNVAVVEIKLAANADKKLMDDLKKLALFRRVLHYEILVEIIIGLDADLTATKGCLNENTYDCDIPINIITLSLDDHHGVDVFQINTLKCTPSRAHDGSVEPIQ